MRFLTQQTDQATSPISNSELEELGEYCYAEVEDILSDEESDLPNKTLLIKGLLERLYHEVSQSEPQYFSNPDSLVSYLLTRYQVPEGVRRAILDFRRFALNLSVLNANPHLAGRFPEALRTACETIRLFTSVPVPPALASCFATPAPAAVQPPQPAPSVLSEARVVVERVSKTSQGESCLLVNHLDLGPLSVFLNGIWTGLAGLVWPHANLFLTHLEMVNGRENSYRTTGSSLITLEPDYLIDASDIMNCFDIKGNNPRISLLNKFLDGTTNRKMILGILVNNLLSVLADNPRVGFSEAIEKALIAQRSLNFSHFITHHEPELEESLRKDSAPHFEAIQRAWNNLSPRFAQTETTFLSNRYGLTGRLDAYLEDSRQPGLKVFLELKSGRAPGKNFTLRGNQGPVPAGIYPNHMAQMACYRMLLSSTFPDHPGIAYILYSSDLDAPLRDAPEIDGFNARVIQLRNQIVAQYHSLARGNQTVFQYFKPGSFGPCPPFLEEPVAQFERTLDGASTLEKKYFHTFVTFIVREHHSGKVGLNGRAHDRGFASLWQVDVPVKEDRYMVIAHLIFDHRHSDPALGRLEFERGRPGLPSNFRVRDPVILYPMNDDGTSEPLRDQIYQFTLTAIDRERVVLNSKNLLSSSDLLLNTKRENRWVIEADFWEASHQGLYQSLYRFLQADPDRKALLLGTRQPSFHQSSFPVSFPDKNPEIHQVLARALQARDYFLLQGPPGTGKTRLFLAHLVQSLIEHSDQNLLVMAFTNRSVDEIGSALSSLDRPVDFLRLGKRLHNTPEDKTLAKICEELTLSEAADRFNRTRVILSTVSSCLTNANLLKAKTFHTAIVDEASQLLEPHLAGILSSVDRFYLIGDEKQLPAIVSQDARSLKVDDPALQSIGLKHQGTSLFERLLSVCRSKGWSEAHGMITRQGRMHQDIQALPNTLFYDRKLRIVHNRQKIETPYLPGPPTLLSRGRVLFIPSLRERRARVNTHEAWIISRLLEMVKSRLPEISRDTIGIITPYRAQIAEIHKFIPADWKDLIQVDTVERFQGSERDVIIVSFAVNHPNQLRYLQSLTLDERVDRKLNVSLTRARQQLILTGCPNLLNRLSHYRKMIDHIRASQGYLQDSVFDPPKP